MKPKKSTFISILLLFTLIIAGCGSSDTETYYAPNGGGGTAVPTAKIVITNEILTRAVPTGVTQIRVTVLDAQQQIVTGPLSFTPAPRIEIDTRPGNNLTLRIEYLVGNTVVGLFEDVISLLPGETEVIAQQQIDFIDASGTLSSLAITPASSTLDVGQPQQLTATGSFSDGSQGDLTSQVEWTATGGATVSQTGLVTGTTTGTATITATLFGKTATTQITVRPAVDPATVVSLTVTPATAALTVGQTQQFSAIAGLQSGGQSDVSSRVTWTSTGNLTITSTGLATATTAGTSTVTASLDGRTSTAQVTIQAAPPQLATSLTVTPATASLTVGDTLQLTATAQYPSGPLNVTNQATYTSSGNATVSATGLVTATSAGTSTITATFEGQTSTSTLTIAPFIPPVAPNPSVSVNFEPIQGHTVGSIHGQQGWSAGPTRDQGVVNVGAYVGVADFSTFGTQALRFSNTTTSGGIDQIFARPIAGNVGETIATGGGQTSGPRFNHFEYELDFGSTRAAQQPGLALSISLDRGDFGRMSFIRLEDNLNGIGIVFTDYNTTTQFETVTIATDLPRNAIHHVKVAFTAIEGVDNDVVQVYVDGVLVKTGKSWEQYYRFDAEAAAEQTPRLVDTISLVSRGTPSANGTTGYLFDNLVMSASNVDPATVVPLP